MKDLLIDTGIYTRALKGDREVVSVLQSASQIGMTSISIGELLMGFRGEKREKQKREELETFLDSPRTFVCVVDENTAEYYAEIWTGLKKARTSISTNDLWIAALAFQHGLKLFTQDGHFKKIAGLLLVS
ncbi:MAG: type II toxin-antitoxin system VapC family toxin [Nitrospinaceae bacterium]